MKSKKVYLALALAAVMSMSACGKKAKPLDPNRLSTTETTTEETTDQSEATTAAQSTTKATTTTTVVTTKAPEKKAAPAKPQAVNSAEIGKNTADAEPKTDAASPIAEVSNAIFLDVSSIVREEASNSYRQVLQGYYKENAGNEAQDVKDIDNTLEEWKKNYKDSGDKAYSETGYKLIMAYSKLASLDNLINANMDKLSDDILAEHDRIGFDLQGNVEIFLNASNMSSIAGDEDFACLDRIAKLRSDTEAELSKPAEPEPQTTQAQQP